MTLKHVFFVAEVVFDWGPDGRTYGEIEQTIVDALNAKGLYRVIMTVEDEEDRRRREIMTCASCGEEA